MARTAKPKTEEEKTVTKRAKKTDEVKQEKTAAVKTATVAVGAEEEKSAKVVDQKELEIENLKAQIEQLKEIVAQAQAQQPQQIIVNADNSERVWFLWMADVADDNVTLIGEHGEYGRIVGKVGTFYVPKNDLSRILDTANRYYIENRWMIVVSGLEDEEREALGVMYKDGELLDQKAFMKITDLDKETLFEIYPALCKSHKDMVASRFHEAFESGKPLRRDVVVELNKIDSNPAYVDIIERMNAKELGQD